ncbi:MAG: hypothetical protein C0391_06835 [Anaerolinea sp.]|nr:hypothetical protein [Anaerolinea sp.]
MEQNSQLVLAHDFSIAFEQMCVMAAVSQTRNSQETLQELVLYCFIRFSDEPFSTPKTLHDEVLVMSGLDFPQHEIDSAIAELIRKQKILSKEGNLNLQVDLKLLLLKNVEDAERLEDDVKNEWFSEVSSEQPLLPLEPLWRGLKIYLSLAFRRHGIQTVSLIDPTVKVSQNGIESLSMMLDSSVDEFATEQKEISKGLIRSFMASVGKSFCRTKYISQMADCAFNYYALAIIPETAEDFRKNLCPLILYLDTNFLFGVLDLTVSTQVAVSIELLEAIKKYKLPFDLRYHQRTEQELLRSITIHRDSLRSTNWNKNISLGILSSRSISGIELRYHQRNAKELIDADSYFLPYEHSDVILSEKKIIRVIPTDDRVASISSLSSDYSDYLVRINRDKPIRLIEHDMTVLDAVRTLRTQAKNTLEAGALLISCDYTLYGFDWETSKREGMLPCTVLPNLFWQLLRPFIPADGDFDRSFAETFAIPEFRLIGSNASMTASKMASILNSYKGISEETATKLLSNELLIGNLRNYLLDEVAFKEQIELAIVKENTELEEEYSALQERFEQSKKSNAELSVSIALKEKELDEKMIAEDKLRNELELSQAQNRNDLSHRQETERNLRDEKGRLEKLLLDEREKDRNNIKLFLTIVSSIVILIVFELLVYELNWTWFINHSKYLGLQGCIFLLIPSIMIFIFMPKHRKSSLFVGSLIAILGVFLSIIDGK